MEQLGLFKARAIKVRKVARKRKRPEAPPLEAWDGNPRVKVASIGGGLSTRSPCSSTASSMARCPSLRSSRT